MKNFIGVLWFLFFLSVKSWASLPIDDFEDGNKLNSLGTNWTTYNDGYSSANLNTISSPGYDQSKYCAQLIFAGKSGSEYQFGGILSLLKQNGNYMDLSAYAGIRFRAKGTGTLETQLQTEATKSSFNHYLSASSLTQEWALYEFKFKDFVQTWGNPTAFDITKAYAIQFHSPGYPAVSDTFFIDNIELFTEEEANPKKEIFLAMPKINQIGYEPEYRKIFSVTFPFAAPGDTFYVRNALDNSIIYQGIINTLTDDKASSGEEVVSGDFSDCKLPGTYFIQIKNSKSEHFKIEPGIYNALHKAALRTFYINRCGVAVFDSASGISHGACHLQDTLIRANNENKDFTGAWHNAGDFGKWTHLNAMNISYMLCLYNLKNEVLDDKGNALLSEARWGLDWMFKMQNADGSVYHKIDTEPYFAVGKRPDQDTLKRYASFQKASNQTPSTIDAAGFVAAMSYAYKTFYESDLSYAILCKAAAEKSWKWINENPGRGQDDPFYTDSTYTQELLWAKSGIYQITHDSSLEQELMKELTDIPAENIGWLTPHAFAYISLFADSNTSVLLKNKIYEIVISYAESEEKKADKSGYGVSMTANEFYWGSNEVIISKGNLFLFAWLMSGNEEYRDYALDQLHYISGRNSLNVSFITGFGGNAVKNPYHWAYLSENKVMKGWVSGGANQYSTGIDALLGSLQKQGTPPAKCFVDGTSWGSNEGQTTINAALVFLTGMFAGGEPILSLGADEDYFEEIPLIFPNPTSRKFFIKGIAENTPLTIYDSNKNITLTGVYKHSGIDLPFTLNDGIYLVQISVNGKTKSLKMVLNNSTKTSW